jgi:hypothetical protein
MKNPNKSNVLSKKKSVRALLFLLFLFSVALRTILGICFGQMNVFYDELLHWNLSKSIYYGIGNNFRNDILNYKEILYSAVIAVSHAFGNTEVQYFVAVGINSVLMSSVVFPVFGMTMEFLKRKEKYSKAPVVVACTFSAPGLKLQASSHINRNTFAKSIFEDKRFLKSIILAFISVFVPEMVYTAKIIQENLYYPLAIWFFYIFIVVIMKNPYRIRNVTAFGAYVFVLSICKQMALNIFAGVVLYYILQFLFFDKKNRRKCVTAIIWFSAGFLVLKFLYGVIFNLVNGLTNISSSEVTIGVILENLIDPYLLSQLIYPAMTYILLSILVFGFFTVLLPGSILKKLSVKERNLFLLVGMIFISTIAVICLRIIPSENLDNVAIRFHFRYLFFLLIPLLVLFMSIYDKVLRIKVTKRICILSGVYLLLLNHIGIMPAQGSKIDCVGYNYIKYLFDSDMMVKTFQLLIVMGVVFGCYLLYKRKVKLLYFLVLASFILSCLVNDCYTYSEYYKNKIDSVGKKEDAFTINSYLHDNISVDQKNAFRKLLIISESKVSDAKLEVYLQYPNYYFCKMDDFDKFKENEENASFGELNLYSFNNDFQDADFAYPEYIISYKPISLDGYEEVYLNLNKYYFYTRTEK